MRPLLLKTAATAITLAAAAAAVVHVNGHLKISTAPLHPTVMGGTVSPAGLGADGRLHLTPSVRSGGAQAVTSTYAS